MSARGAMLVALVVAVTGLAVVPGAVRAGTVTVELDPARTRVEFVLPDVVGSVRGTFRLARGRLELDPATGAARGAIVVTAASGESGNRLRDREMHASVLESARYASIVFTPSRVRGTVAARGASHVEVDGELELHGARRPVTLVAALDVAGEHVGADVHFTLAYPQWGVRNPSLLFLHVGDTVEVHVTAEGRLTPPLAPAL